jgi:amino-acid N-acetyltransferase
MRIHPHPAAAGVRRLLAACNLPVADLDDEHLRHFFACGAQGDPSGVVGVELHGEFGLLRSLAVEERARGRGCGKRLVEQAEQYAATCRVQSLYLLTTAARDFFAALGYKTVDRAQAPEPIQNTAQFSSLCPSSATVMVKNLADYQRDEWPLTLRRREC